MAEKFGQEVLTMIGFLDGINESLLIEIDLDTVEEDTVVSLAFDKERLYKNMVAAKADWLYELPQWKEIFSEEELKKFYKEQKESTTIRKPKKIGRNDPCPCGSGKNIKMLWQIIFLVTGILSLIYYSAICIALKKWDSTFQILAGDRNSGNCRECADPFIWNAVYRRNNDWYFGMFSSDRRDKDHKRNAQKTFGKKKRTL